MHFKIAISTLVCFVAFQVVIAQDPPDEYAKSNRQLETLLEQIGGLKLKMTAVHAAPIEVQGLKATYQTEEFMRNGSTWQIRRNVFERPGFLRLRTRETNSLELWRIDNNDVSKSKRAKQVDCPQEISPGNVRELLKKLSN